MRRILIVEGDEDARRWFTRALSKTFAVRCVANPAEARSLFAWDEFDAIVCDYRLPSGLGTDFLADVRRDMPRALRILMSANDVPRLPTREAPSWEVFLRKPFTSEALHQALERRRKAKR